MADLSNDIATQAVEPASVTADGQTAAARSVGELIEADRYLAAKTAAKKKRRGLMFTKLVPPPAAGDCTGSGGSFGGGVM